jgi:hypothetical protein
MFHAQPPEPMGVDQNFPISLEVQFLGGAPDRGALARIAHRLGKK